MNEFYLWLFCAFLCGALPFSVWVGRFALSADITQFGDGNPGATNVLRAGGRRAAFLALALDFAKGFIPVGLANLTTNYEGMQLALIALMPIAGHGWSPFLGGRGGKGVAVSFGIWSGLTAWEAPISAGAFIVLGVLLFGANGWAVMTALLGVLVCLLSIPLIPYDFPMRADQAALWWALAGNALFFAWKYRADLAAGPRSRSARGSVI